VPFSPGTDDGASCCRSHARYPSSSGGPLASSQAVQLPVVVRAVVLMQRGRRTWQTRFSGGTVHALLPLGSSNWVFARRSTSYGRLARGPACRHRCCHNAGSCRAAPGHVAHRQGQVPGVIIERTGAALVVRLAALVVVEVAAVAVHRLVGGAQVMGIGESMLRLARETVQLRPAMRGVGLGDRLAWRPPRSFR